MAELINCKQVTPQSITGLNSTSNNINNIVLFIEPENSNGLVYTVDARDFTDFTHLLPADDIDGIATDNSSNGLAITIEDEGTPGTPENRIKVTVDINDDYMISADRTIKIDIGGEAKFLQQREVILALATDFANQIRGGNIPIFDATTSTTTNTDFPGMASVAKVTFTANAPATQILSTGTTTSSPQSNSVDFLNDYSKGNDMVYVKSQIQIGEWCKIGTIKVEIDASQEASGINIGSIPPANVARYGFVQRKPGEGFNNYQESSAISKFQNVLSNNIHQLRTKDDEEFETPHAAADVITASDLGSTTYKYHAEPEHVFNGTSQAVKSISQDRTFLTKTWERSWWFKYPAPQVGGNYGNIDTTQLVFYHSSVDISGNKFNRDNDLGLTGLLVAAPIPSSTFKISKIEFDDVWSSMNLNNVDLPEVDEADKDGEDDYAYVIPVQGNSGERITITGDPGAKFRLEMESVSVEDFTTGRSIGSNTDTSFRGLLTFEDILANTGEGGQLGTTQIVTLDGTGQETITMPVIGGNYTNNVNNYYIRVIAESDTEIQQTAHDSKYGADISSGNHLESFNKGLNFYGGPGNTFSIRARQNPSVKVDLQIDTSEYTANGENISVVTGAGYSGTGGVQLYEADKDPTLAQFIPFVFTIQGSGTGQFIFNDGAYTEQIGTTQNTFALETSVLTDSQINTLWPSVSGYQCVTNNQSDGVCILREVYEEDYYRPGAGVRLYEHDFPVSGAEGPNIIPFHELYWMNRLTVNNFASNIRSPWSFIDPTGGDFVLALAGANELVIRRTGNDSSFESAYVQAFFNTVSGITYEATVDIPSMNNANPASGAATSAQLVISPDIDLLSTDDQIITTITSTGQLTITFTAIASRYLMRIFIRNAKDNQDRINIGETIVRRTERVDDHSLTTNEGEDVTIHNVIAVKGKVINGAQGYNGDTSALEIDSGSDFNDYLSVVGVLQVNSYGPLSNEYKLNMRHIARWST